MKLPRQTVENAAFWDLAVCLDCGNQQARAAIGGSSECDECESANVLPAELVLVCADFVEEGDD
jgi:predicted Zn-ribbon and HTH transcriptional regulator